VEGKRPTARRRQSDVPVVRSPPPGESECEDVTRRTEALHEFGHCQHLSTIVVVGFESGDLGSKSPLVVEPGCSLDECGADRFGAGHAPRLELAEGTACLIIESH
jgi:hypothetical protein